MVKYTETVVCPVCGLKTDVGVQCWGDYDPPEKAEEADPVQCPSCQMLKVSNPEIYKMVFRLWQKLKDERKENEKRIQGILKETYDRNDLWSPFSLTDDRIWKKLESYWKKTFKSYEKISSKYSSKKDDSFEYEETIKLFVQKIIDEIEKEKLRFEKKVESQKCS